MRWSVVALVLPLAAGCTAPGPDVPECHMQAVGATVPGLFDLLASSDLSGVDVRHGTTEGLPIGKDSEGHNMTIRWVSWRPDGQHPSEAISSRDPPTYRLEFDGDAATLSATAPSTVPESDLRHDVLRMFEDGAIVTEVEAAAVADAFLSSRSASSAFYDGTDERVMAYVYAASGLHADWRVHELWQALVATGSTETGPWAFEFGGEWWSAVAPTWDLRSDSGGYVAYTHFSVEPMTVSQALGRLNQTLAWLGSQPLVATTGGYLSDGESQCERAKGHAVDLAPAVGQDAAA